MLYCSLKKKVSSGKFKEKIFCLLAKFIPRNIFLFVLALIYTRALPRTLKPKSISRRWLGFSFNLHFLLCVCVCATSDALMEQMVGKCISHHFSFNFLRRLLPISFASVTRKEKNCTNWSKIRMGSVQFMNSFQGLFTKYVTKKSFLVTQFCEDENRKGRKENPLPISSNPLNPSTQVGKTMPRLRNSADSNKTQEISLNFRIRCSTY